MKTSYLGLELRSPVIVAASPYTQDAVGVARCVRNGAGAVVLKSIFEEEIIQAAARMECHSPQTAWDAGEEITRYLEAERLNRHLRLIRNVRSCGVPIIASINCVSGSAQWVDYAVEIEQAGASALELNIFFLPDNRHETAAELEAEYVSTVARVVEAVRIPVSVKLPRTFTNLFAVADALSAYGARGAVLFNRYFEPDIDIERMTFRTGDPFSRASELRSVLRSVALCAQAVPKLEWVISSGVHDGEGAVQALLCGARAVEICTAIHRFGYGVISYIGRFIDAWVERHGFETWREVVGRMLPDEGAYNPYRRTQYMKYAPCVVTPGEI